MNEYDFFTSREIKPTGWLRRQLEIQASGLAGNLDKIWPDVRDSAWIGGAREGWERVPYWLDGFIPLAYLLDNDDMKKRAQRYIDAIIAGQKEDGWICPCPDDKRAEYDTWALMLIGKVLCVYYDSTGDARIKDVLYRAMKNFYELLSAGKIKLIRWGKSRWFECFVALNRLYDLYGEEWLKDLAKILKAQGQDFNELVPLWERPLNKWCLETHIVNLMMMLKFEALSNTLLGEEYTNAAERLYRLLLKYNGTPVGIFTGDECLSGLSPIQGTELCSVVEEMYSFELLYAKTGDPVWAERLEKIAFNALPATISDDMWTHQYVQQSNQISCLRFPGKSLFRTNNSEAHLFGLEPHFGCCTANFGQGWPKLALSTFMRAKDGIVSALPLPSVLETEFNGVAIKIELITEYPFENRFTYKIGAASPVSMALNIRIPSFAKKLSVNGRPARMKSMLTFKQVWEGENVITLEYSVSPRLVRRPYGLYAAEMGSLVFSLPVKAEYIMREYERNGVVRKFPYCDYELKGRTDWSFAYAGSSFEAIKQKGDDIPFSSANPRIVLKAKTLPINWGFEDGYDTVCAKTPQSRRPAGESRETLLYPYGCAKLRMTELPLIKPKK